MQVWPVSVRTDVCVDKHEVGMRVLPSLRRWTRDVCSHTCLLAVLWYPASMTHEPPVKQNSPLDGTLSERLFPSLSLWPSLTASGKPCFNLKSKIKLSSKMKNLRVSQKMSATQRL